MKLKLDAEGHVVLQEGKPIYTADDGKEFAFDAKQMHDKIIDLGRENASQRTRGDQAENKLKAFEGIEDPAAAKKALATVKNLDDKKLVDAGEVEKVKNEAITAVEAKYKPIVEERDALRGDLYSEKIGGAFSRSKFLADKAAIPADLVQARFGQNFKIENGKIVATDLTGNKIFSRARPGESADFEEALEILVDQYPHKDQILKGTGSSGSGANHGSGGGNGDPQIKKRSDLKSREDRVNFVQKHGNDAYLALPV